jgi:predicted O-methyltransferase YrrM
VTLEIDPHHAEVARQNLDRAGLARQVDVRVGPALDSLTAMTGEDAFDLVFIDADKPNNPVYLDRSLLLSRPGTVIVVDNVVRGGAVVDAASADANVVGVRRCLERLASEPRLDATAMQTVGSKGYDGFAIALVR